VVAAVKTNRRPDDVRVERADVPLPAERGVRIAARRGYALVELLSALGTVAALLLVTSALFRLASRTTFEIGDRAEALDALRTATALLDRELRPLTPADFRLAPPDSIALRAFRGLAVPCDSAGAALRVRYVGIREPDPAKDSVVAVTRGGEVGVGLSAAGVATPDAACAPLNGEAVRTLTTSPPVPAAAVLLVFERGAYSIGAAALRYRRGLGGRQPLTAPAFTGGGSGLRPSAHNDAIELHLDVGDDAATFALPARARVPLANRDSVPAP
jgi:hypothetical protein